MWPVAAYVERACSLDSQCTAGGSRTREYRLVSDGAPSSGVCSVWARARLGYPTWCVPRGEVVWVAVSRNGAYV